MLVNRHLTNVVSTSPQGNKLTNFKLLQAWYSRYLRA